MCFTLLSAVTSSAHVLLPEGLIYILQPFDGHFVFLCCLCFVEKYSKKIEMSWRHEQEIAFLSSPPAILCQFPFLSLNNTGPTSELFLTFLPFLLQGKAQICSCWTLPPSLPCESDSRAYIMCAFQSRWFLLGDTCSFPQSGSSWIGSRKEGQWRQVCCSWLTAHLTREASCLCPHW